MSSLSTFRFDEQLTNTIEQLKAATGATSKAEIVRRAITLLKIAQEAQQNGEQLVLREKDGGKERQIIIP